MNITITRKISDDLNFLNDYLNEQASKLRKAQVDAILKFKRQYLNEAIAKLTENEETYPEDLSIPDDIIKGIAQQAGMVDVMTPATKESEGVLPKEEEPQPEQSDQFFGKESANGHKIEKKRDLLDTEKDSLRAFFESVDGQVEEDGCVTLKNSMDADVGIFQVTGFISYLHREVASGKKLNDVEGYIEWMKSKYPALMERYNSDKYVALRRQNDTYTA